MLFGTLNRCILERKEKEYVGTISNVQRRNQQIMTTRFLVKKGGGHTRVCLFCVAFP